MCFFRVVYKETGIISVFFWRYDLHLTFFIIDIFQHIIMLN